MGCGPLGYVPLRQAIAEYLSRSRGVRCVPDQVALVSGVQEAIDLAARLLLNPDDAVCIEEPGYRGVDLAFRAFRAKIHAVEVNRRGIDLRYSGRPIPALQGLDDHGLVLYAGSFSTKFCFPLCA